MASPSNYRVLAVEPRCSSGKNTRAARGKDRAAAVVRVCRQLLDVRDLAVEERDFQAPGLEDLLVADGGHQAHVAEDAAHLIDAHAEAHRVPAASGGSGAGVRRAGVGGLV